MTLPSARNVNANWQGLFSFFSHLSSDNGTRSTSHTFATQWTLIQCSKDTNWRTSKGPLTAIVCGSTTWSSRSGHTAALWLNDGLLLAGCIEPSQSDCWPIHQRVVGHWLSRYRGLPKACILTLPPSTSTSLQYGYRACRIYGNKSGLGELLSFRRWLWDGRDLVVAAV